MSEKRPRHYAVQVLRDVRAGASREQALEPVPPEWRGLVVAHCKAWKAQRQAKSTMRGAA